MAHNLYQLSYYTGNRDWEAMVDRMLTIVAPMAKAYGSAFSNWLDLMLRRSAPMQEVVICGEGAVAELKKLHAKGYRPYLMVDGCESEEKTAATRNRLVPNELFFYSCRDRTCDLPVRSMQELYL
jgi:uncharacterized protein YyaL (SSP411 family)